MCVSFLYVISVNIIEMDACTLDERYTKPSMYTILRAAITLDIFNTKLKNEYRKISEQSDKDKILHKRLEFKIDFD